MPGKHYMLPVAVRCREVFNLFGREQYFVIHAARQDGKTTLLGALSTELNGGSDFRTLYCSLESVQVIFGRRPDIPWDERIGWKTLKHDGHTIHIVRC